MTPPVDRVLPGVRVPSAGSGRTIEERVRAIEEAAHLISGVTDAPKMITVLRFANDSLNAAEAYCERLKAHYATVSEPPFIQLLDIDHPRHPRHRPDWEYPAAHLDRLVTAEELHDRRPDLRPPGPDHTRGDWRND